MFKIMRRSTDIEVKYMIGVDPASDGLARAALGGNVFGWTADRQASFDILDAFT